MKKVFNNPKIKNKKAVAMPVAVLGIFLLSMGLLAYFGFVKERKKNFVHDINAFQAEFIAHGIYQAISDEILLNGESTILKEVLRLVRENNNYHTVKLSVLCLL